MILRPFSNKRLLSEPYTKKFLNVIALDTKYQTKFHLQNKNLGSSGLKLIFIGCMKPFYFCIIYILQFLLIFLNSIVYLTFYFNLFQLVAKLILYNFVYIFQFIQPKLQFHKRFFKVLVLVNNNNPGMKSVLLKFSQVSDVVHHINDTHLL